MTYTKVKKLLEGGDRELDERYSHIMEDLGLMRELAELLMTRRGELGSIDFDLPEPQIILDIEGRIEDIVRSERNIAHRIIEEFMLAANRAVAEEFFKRDLPFLYRIHEEPDPERIDDFREFAAGFGIHFKSGGGPKAFQAVLKQVEDRPEERLINTVLLRTMKQAVYSPDNVGHFGLAFRDYTHFTSPIRRYPDLVVHRLLKLLLSGGYKPREQERMSSELPGIAAQSSARERKAMEAEREIVDLKKAQFMQDKVGEVFEGIISGVTNFGFFVELKEWFVEGLVHISNLADDYYIYEEKKHTLIGEHTNKTYRLADDVTVRLASVDLERRRIELRVADDETGKGGRARGGGKKKAGRAKGPKAGGTSRKKSGAKGGAMPGKPGAKGGKAKPGGKGSKRRKR
jgi:ribonuclease R